MLRYYVRIPLSGLSKHQKLNKLKTMLLAPESVPASGANCSKERRICRLTYIRPNPRLGLALVDLAYFGGAWREIKAGFPCAATYLFGLSHA